MASQYETAQCPSCRAALLSRYRTDLSGEHRTHTRCPKCKERVLVVYGDGRVKTYKD